MITRSPSHTFSDQERKRSFSCINHNALLTTMEVVMSTLDEQGVFGMGARRKCMLINAEVMPPDYTKTLRALRLNEKEDIKVWLREAAEDVAGYIEGHTEG